MKNKTYTPTPLNNVAEDNRNKLMVLLSGNYFKVANELREFSKNKGGQHPYHYYVFPCITFYMAAVEAYFHEIVALSIARATDIGIIENLNNLNRQSAPYNDFKCWVREIYKLHDQAKNGIDTNSDTYLNLVALKELRNTVIHYNQTFIEHTDWPVRLQEAVRRSKIDVINSDWATNLCSSRVSDWAHDTAKDAVRLFYNMSAIGHDVFDGEEHLRWE